MADDLARLGAAALGARLRRLSATIDADAARVYAEQGIRFEQRWFGVINKLALDGPMSVGMLADALGITQPSVSQTRQSLVNAGLVRAAPDSADLRSRILALSETGEDLVRQLRPMWDMFDEVARELDAEAGGVTEALAKLDEALARKSLHARLMDRIAIGTTRAEPSES